jgi:hypothetical protein
MEWLQGNWIWILAALAMLAMHLFGHGGHGGHGGQSRAKDRDAAKAKSGERHAGHGQIDSPIPAVVPPAHMPVGAAAASEPKLAEAAPLRRGD